MNPMIEMATLLDLERGVWEAVVSGDRNRLCEAFSDDYVEVTACGKRVLRNEVVEQSPEVDQIETYEISDPRLIPLPPASAILSYHLRLTGTLRGEPIVPATRWVTSIWRAGDGQTKCCFFQQTGARKGT